VIDAVRDGVRVALGDWRMGRDSTPSGSWGRNGTHLRMMGSGSVKRPSFMRGAGSGPGSGTVDITDVSAGGGACEAACGCCPCAAVATAAGGGGGGGAAAVRGTGTERAV